jgi:hypothetical protein
MYSVENLARWDSATLLAESDMSSQLLEKINHQLATQMAPHVLFSELYTVLGVQL